VTAATSLTTDATVLTTMTSSTTTTTRLTIMGDGRKPADADQVAAAVGAVQVGSNGVSLGAVHSVTTAPGALGAAPAAPAPPGGPKRTPG
jgi:hypothetical protein